MVDMAKPIESTPVLKGDDIRKFYETMRKENSSPDPKRIELIIKGQDVFSKIARK
jgi:hypothetical protein